MKRILLTLLLVLPFVANAMKIERDEIDEFTGNRTVITSWEGMSKGEIHIRFRQQENHLLLDFKFMSRTSIVIGDDDPLLFKSTSDDICQFNSVGLYYGGKGDGAVGLNGSGVWGIYATYRGDLSWFKDNLVRLIRIQATDCYYNRQVSESDGKKLIKLYDLFISAINNTPGTKIFDNYTLRFMKKKAKSSSWDMVKEEYKKDLSPDELDDIVTEWKNQSTENTIYDVVIKKDK